MHSVFAGYVVNLPHSVNYFQCLYWEIWKTWKHIQRKNKINDNKVQSRKGYISKETFIEQAQNFRGTHIGKYSSKLRRSVRKWVYMAYNFVSGKPWNIPHTAPIWCWPIIILFQYWRKMLAATDREVGTCHMVADSPAHGVRSTRNRKTPATGTMWKSYVIALQLNLNCSRGGNKEPKIYACILNLFCYRPDWNSL